LWHSIFTESYILAKHTETKYDVWDEKEKETKQRNKIFSHDFQIPYYSSLFGNGYLTN